MSMNVHSSIIVIAKMVEITKCPSIDWINTLWSIHTMQDYSAKKKKEWSTDTCYSVDESWKQAK